MLLIVCNWSALHVAAEKGHVDIAKVMTRFLADVEAVHVRQLDGIHLAVEMDMLTLRKC